MKPRTSLSPREVEAVAAAVAAMATAAAAANAAFLSRPLAWQERETHRWLLDLGLEVAAHEASAPMLDNPYR